MRWGLLTLVVMTLLVAPLSGCLTSDTENESPQAFAGEDVEAEVGQDVVFTGTGLDGDGSVVAFRWDYDGDGEWDYSGDTGARIHRYTRPGEYEAVLQVEDDDGAWGEDRRWVNVTASIAITVDWANGTGFRIHVPEGLEVDDMEVDWDIVGTGPSPVGRTFTHDAGLVRVDNTTYAVDPAVGVLEEGLRHVVKVRLGQVVTATRTVDVVDTSDPADPYRALYNTSLEDSRTYGGNWTELNRVGELTVERSGGRSSGRTEGTGTWTAHTNVSGIVSLQTVNLSRAVVVMGPEGFGDIASWRYQGNGTIEQWQPDFYVFAFVKDMHRAAENGSLVKDDWRRVGVYRGQNGTNGTFEWARTSLGNQVRQNGDGDLFEVLKVMSEKEFAGTNQGLNFSLHNLTLAYEASRLVFDNRTLFSQSEQQVGLQGTEGAWQWTNTSWSGFMDTNGDGDHNPDPLLYDPELAAVFSGPRPRVLHVGDTFSATNLYGLSLTYLAKRPDTAPLETPTGPVEVTGVLAEALSDTTWGQVHHWFWVLEDGPLPGLVFEEEVRVERDVYGGGVHDWYRNIVSVEPFT